jgi:hypothetical protein
MLQINIVLDKKAEKILVETLGTYCPTLNLELIYELAKTGEVACIASSEDPLDFYKLGILVNEISKWVEAHPSV